MAIVRPIVDQAMWEEWQASRPPVVQDLCRRYPPDRLYHLSPVGQRVTIHAYNEDGTVTVLVTGDYNCVVFERQVFGIDPENLTECELPSPDEPLGAVLTVDAEVEAFIAAERERRGL